MSFDVSVAGIALPTDVSALKSFQNDRNLAFAVDHTFAAVLDDTLDKVPPANAKSAVSYTAPDASWCPLGSAVTFGLGGGAGGSVEILSSGDLVSYSDGLDTPKTESVPVPAGSVYVKLALDFSLSANASGAWSGGAYGVKASGSDASKFTIAFCKAFAPSTPLRAALAEVFQSFVLPFHAATLDQMAEGDFLFYDFDGNLHLAFGAYTGLDKVAYAGQCSMDVLKCFGSPLATVCAKCSPEVKAGATLDFSFQYSNRFEVLLSKMPGAARLHLFRSAKTDTTTTLAGNLGFDANTSASISAHTETMQDSLAEAAGGQSTDAGKVVSAVAGAAASECGKYVDEVNDKLTAWLNKGNGRQSNLQVAIEATNSRTILAGYTFDLTSPQYGAAWKAAIDGNFVAAFGTGAVTLDAGSGLENEYRNKTCFTCNFFNLWHWSTWNSMQSTASLVYAGNNAFHFSANVGRAMETDAVGAMHSLNFYFAATAGVGTSGVVQTDDIVLHLDMTAQGDRKAISTIATMLSLLDSGADAAALARGMHAFATNSKTGTAQLKVSISPTAYARIQCDPYASNKLSSSTANDAANWTAFAQAADDLDAWPLHTMSTASAQALAYFKSYGAWQKLNQSVTGESTPTRLEFGDESTSNWPDDFPNLDDGSKVFVMHSMHAGQQFMNFCAALYALTQAQDTAAAGEPWQALLKLISDAIKIDTSIDFIRPTALAVIRLCNASALQVTGPVGAATPTDHFAVGVSL